LRHDTKRATFWLRLALRTGEEQDMTDQIEREVRLPTSAPQAWRALTDPRWLERWLADEVELELSPGGEARFKVGDSVRSGWIEEVSPPAADREGRLVFWWAEGDEPASRVELELRPEEYGCTLRVVEARPLELLDLVGIPLQRPGEGTYGPAMIVA
jgi:uncharacterized protein YndB with AHSA1/START domain